MKAAANLATNAQVIADTEEMMEGMRPRDRPPPSLPTDSWALVHWLHSQVRLPLRPPDLPPSSADLRWYSLLPSFRPRLGTILSGGPFHPSHLVCGSDSLLWEENIPPYE